MTDPYEFTLGLDLDGVCADYSHIMRQVVARLRGTGPGLLTKEHDWHFTEWGLDDKEFHTAHDIVVDEGWFAYAPVLPGAKDALHNLSSLGVKIRVVTSRAVYPRHLEGVLQSTSDWFAHNYIPYDEICLVEKKTDVLCDIYIDDSPKQIRRLQEAGRAVLIYDQPWNRYPISDISGMRVYHWSEAEKMIKGLFNARVPLAHPRETEIKTGHPAAENPWK